MTSFSFLIPPSSVTMQATINITAAPSSLVSLVLTPPSLTQSGNVVVTGFDQYGNPVNPTLSGAASSNSAVATGTISGNVVQVQIHGPGSATVNFQAN